MTPKQIRLVKFLLGKNGLLDMEKEVVYNYTKGRTTDLKDMAYKETYALVNDLQGNSDSGTKRTKMIAKVFSIAHEMHWEISKGDVDLEHIDQFCLTKTKYKKKLSQFTNNELPELVTVLERVRDSFLKGL